MVDHVCYQRFSGLSFWNRKIEYKYLDSSVARKYKKKFFILNFVNNIWLNIRKKTDKNRTD